jgi:hypothetical protein
MAEKSLVFFAAARLLCTLAALRVLCCYYDYYTAYEQHTWPNLRGDALSPAEGGCASELLFCFDVVCILGGIELVAICMSE